MEISEVIPYIIPVVISLVGTIPAVLTYLNNRKTRYDNHRSISDTTKVQTDTVNLLLDTARKSLIEPLKERINELDTENKMLRGLHDELMAKNLEQQRQISDLQCKFAEAIHELNICREDLMKRLEEIDKRREVDDSRQRIYDMEHQDATQIGRSD